MSLDRLIEAIDKTGNPTVVGLDPKLDFIPPYIIQKAITYHQNTLEAAASALLEFNMGLIDALYDIVPAIKPQAAFYEMYGWPGVRTLHHTIKYAKEKGMFVITDAKRGDIGSSMQAYADAHLGTTQINDKTYHAFNADALTVNAYLGSDGIMPALEVCKQHDKGIVVLVKTSNPSSGEIQDLEVNGKPVYWHMAKLCQEWGKQLPGKYNYSGVAIVVGATYPDQLTSLRSEFKDLFFLVPGYGAQGGGANDVAGAFDSNGRGAIVNSSRGIMCAWQLKNAAPEDYAKLAREEALRMKNDIIGVL